MSIWKKYRLDHLCTKVGSGATPRGGDASYKTEGISLIRSQNILDFVFSKGGLAFIDDEQAKALLNVEIKEGDVLINITGDSVARVCQVPNDILPARVNQHVAILRTNQSKLNSEFLKYALLTRQNKEMLLSLASTGATRKALTKTMLEEFEIYAPEDVELQSRIAFILSSLDDKIELNRRMNQTLEQMAQALFNHYFVDNIDLDNLPYGWKSGKLGQMLELKYGKALKEKQRKNGNYAVVGSGGIIGYHNEFICGDKGVVVGRKGNSGAVTWLHEAFYPIDTTFYVSDLLGTNGLYYYYFLLKSLNLKSLNSDSAVPGLNRNEAHHQEILIPDNKKIIEFNNLVTSFFDKIKINLKEIRTLTTIRDTLLPKLMSREIDVDAINNEEAVIKKYEAIESM